MQDSNKRKLRISSSIRRKNCYYLHTTNYRAIYASNIFIDLMRKSEKKN